MKGSSQNMISVFIIIGFLIFVFLMLAGRLGYG